ncbi:uncharacterized protein KY384_000674 [Bacidia gigantensis]|uniref:uncharacterized protein n=1 Tax=Bacidia gigantensis TaxID=2732470 RepID=UPI001D0396D1|nr:uncharacterized protein KY384_000674 [Bacidia gigantensis]KAG8525912.1 hypothetical protein KY384_000674 [Bacidia gigantensis]
MAYELRLYNNFHDPNINLLLSALASGRWTKFWLVKTMLDPNQQVLADFASERMCLHALESLGRSYLNFELSYLEQAVQKSWGSLTKVYDIKWTLDGNKVTVAVITGSGQGIGAETARLFAKEGAHVVVQDIDASKAEAVSKEINDSGGRAIAIPGDMLDSQHIADLVKKSAEFGHGRLHCLINCAGFTWDGVIHKMTDKQWDTILALHNTAPFKLVRAAAPYFRVKDGQPRNIINISSTSGIHGNAGQANYGLAKAGVTGLTKVIAKEWGPQFGVRANTVAFGHISTRLTAAKEEGAFVTTPDGQKVALGIPKAQKEALGEQAYMDIPLRRAGTATEAASVILAVASPLFSYVSGQTIMVTGGRNM